MDKYKIKDICDLNLCTITPKDKYSSILYLDTSSILCNQISNLQIVSIKDAPSRAKRKVKNNTIVYSTVRPNLKHFGIISNPPNNFIVSTGFTTIDIKKEYESTIDARYVFFLLTNQSIVDYLSTMAESAVSAYPSINPDDIGELCFNFPHIDIQKKVASVIFYIDEKIALNSRVNAELEAMAKQLYDYWFVQFDFPDENGKPYKSSGGKMVYNEKLKREIPEGWEVKCIKECISQIERGMSYSSASIATKEGIPMINLACFTKQGDYRIGELKFYNETYDPSYIVHEGDMLFACTDMTRDADIIGTPIIVNYEYERFVYSSDLARITPTTIEKSYLYFAMKDKTFHNYIKKFASGSLVLHLDVDGVRNYPIIIPQIALQKEFGIIYESMIKKKNKLTNEIIQLTQLRDSLHPMLMNGQVTVEE